MTTAHGPFHGHITDRTADGNHVTITRLPGDVDGLDDLAGEVEVWSAVNNGNGEPYARHLVNTWGAGGLRRWLDEHHPWPAVPSVADQLRDNDLRRAAEELRSVASDELRAALRGVWERNGLDAPAVVADDTDRVIDELTAAVLGVVVGIETPDPTPAEPDVAAVPIGLADLLDQTAGVIDLLDGATLRGSAGRYDKGELAEMLRRVADDCRMAPSDPDVAEAPGRPALADVVRPVPDPLDPFLVPEADGVRSPVDRALDAAHHVRRRGVDGPDPGVLFIPRSAMPDHPTAAADVAQQVRRHLARTSGAVAGGGPQVQVVDDVDTAIAEWHRERDAATTARVAGKLADLRKQITAEGRCPGCAAWPGTRHGDDCPEHARQQAMPDPDRLRDAAGAMLVAYGLIPATEGEIVVEYVRRRLRTGADELLAAADRLTDWS